MLAQALLLATLAAVGVIQGLAAAIGTKDDFEVKNVVRTIELAGGVSAISTAYTLARPSRDASAAFYAALSEEEWAALSQLDIVVDSPRAWSKTALSYEHAGIDPEDPATHLVAIDLSPLSSIQSHDGIDEFTFSVKGTFNHLVAPLPASAPQGSPVFLAWRGDAGIRTLYPAQKGRTKVSVSSTKIPDYAPRQSATKLGNKVTYGPFKNIPSYRDSSVEQGMVQYELSAPVLSVVSLERVAEVSHWAGNLAIEDRAWLRNDGPLLEGHFGRIDHQASSFRGQQAPSTVVGVRIPLPPGAKEAYVVDAIGNVSTSRFSPSPPNPELIGRSVQTLNPHQASVLDLVPRYPLLGGWNYTFSYGFNLDAVLGGWGKVLGAGHFSLAVPFLTPIDADSVYDEVSLKVVLPEGAENVQVFAPFAVDEQSALVTKTYLDTSGRKTIQLKKKNCTEKHSQLVYVQYTLSTLSTLQKPLAVTLVTMAVLVAAALLRRFDVRIKRPAPC